MSHIMISLLFICAIVVFTNWAPVQASGNQTMVYMDQPQGGIYKTTMYVQGWVMSQEENVQIRAFLNQTEVTNQLKRVQRNDVLKSSYATQFGSATLNPTPGYQGTIDLTPFKNGTYRFTVQARSSKTGAVLKEISQTITIKKYTQLLCLDSPSNNLRVKDNVYVSGWLMSDNRNAQIKVFIDKQDVSNKISRVQRTDVLKAIPGYGGSTKNPTPGYKGTIDLSGFADGQHTFTIQVYDAVAKEIMYSHQVTLTIKKYTQLLCLDMPSNLATAKDSVYISGWLMSEDRDAQIRVYIDQNNVSSSISRVQRPDVLKAISGYGGSTKNPTPGYKGTVDLSGIKDGAHTLTIQVYHAKTNEVMYSHKQTLNIKKYTSLVCLDEPKVNGNTNYMLHVKGWVLSDNPNAKVYVSVDGKDFTANVTRVERKDVLKAYPNSYGGSSKNAKPGFEANVDLAGIKDGTRTITLKIVSPKTNEILFQTSRTIVVKKYTGKVHIDAPSQGVVTSGSLYVEGWEMSESMKTSVQIFVDNVQLPATITRKQRTDVLKAVTGYGGKARNATPGYTATVNVTKYADGKHTLKVKVLSDVGDAIAEMSKIIEIRNHQYWGIDVSYWQGTIDYDALVATKEVDFMIARAGYGKLPEQKDTQFERNYAEAKKRKIPIGTYLYSYATTVEDAKKEANNLLTWLKGKSFELPVFYDVEDASQQHLSKELKTDICLAFCEIIKNAGHKVGIYSSKNWISSQIDLTRIPEDHHLWVASYGANNAQVPSEEFAYAGEHHIWQYSSTGKMNGIQGAVDFNICYYQYF